MNKALIFCVICLIAAASLTAQTSDVVYTEGWVDVKDSSGEIFELFIGDSVVVGETVITGDDGLAELQPEEGSRIIIQPGTVFSLQERVVDGKKRSVVSTALGEVTFRFNKMTGAEPEIATPSMVCGVRGTEFTVFAGADGSSLIVVDSGAVEVASQGKTVDLAPNEGVEVQPGEPPGEKFPVMRGSLDFTSWNQNRADEMLSDPLLALARMEVQLTELGEQVQEWVVLFEENRKVTEEKRAFMKSLVDQGKDEEAKVFFTEELRPLEVETSDLVLNYRYYTLSALNFRRHVLSGFYTRMKMRHLVGTAVDYSAFRDAYGSLLGYYEEQVVPFLVKADF